jgi:coenzyme PQQ synthesis protein D (PqqD)
MSTVPSHIRSIINHDGAVLLDIPRDQMVTLNSTGAYIWERLQQGRSIDEVIHDLSTESKTDPFIVERDVHAFLEQLMSKHLLQR